MDTLTNPWIIHQRPNQEARLHLFCFPYGGASAQAYYCWKDVLPTEVALSSIQLPGRGARLREPPMTRLVLLVQELARAIRPYLNKPFAFFGHSLGAVIAFELARELRKTSGHLPSGCFVSARRAPQIPASGPPIHQLPDEAFLKEIERYSGTPREILADTELMELLLPALRADFECLETYQYQQEPPPRMSDFRVWWTK